MTAVRKIYRDMPETIDVPNEFRHKIVEVIMFPLEDDESQNCWDTILSLKGMAKGSYGQADEYVKSLRDEWK